MGSLVRVSLFKFELPVLWYTLLQEQVTSVPNPFPCGFWGVGKPCKIPPWMLFLVCNKPYMLLIQGSFSVFCHYTHVELAADLFILPVG